MSKDARLQQYLEEAAVRRPGHTAVEESEDAAISYADLDALANRLRDRLRHLGVREGDRVGVYLRKSIDSVATIFGILKSGAAYVPVDPEAPAPRNAGIHNDCSVKAVVLEKKLAEKYQDEIGKLGDVPTLIEIDGVGGGTPLGAALDALEATDPAPVTTTVIPSPDSLAYILYTSGSTGKPKGVMLTQRNAVSFVEWCWETFRPSDDDRFSSHAPFHFDLSILDLYLPMRQGATLVVIGEQLGKYPAGLAELIENKKITSWYSTPSILSLLYQHGKLDERDRSSLRTVLFAGEVFPVKHLRAVKALVPDARFYNLYGPTETNVCTYYEVPGQIEEDRTEPYPIGKVCSNAEGLVVDESGHAVTQGSEGELCIRGDAVTQGYWNMAERTEQAFLVTESGDRWYRTGDVVIEEPGGDFKFVGRRDRMVKRRGYRVELGEIEAALYANPVITEAAVVAIPDEERGILVRAFLAWTGEKKPSMIALKSYCAGALPRYMIPDQFTFLDALPKTSTDKVDYQKLLAID
jgi:amino acid adenylation domain-containing protein